MEFGKIENVDQVRWDLPLEDPLTGPYLQKQKLVSPASGCQFFIGAPAWGAKEWVGTLYPPKTPASDYLYHYARNFNCIELNTTHYGIPSAETVKKWVGQVPAEFHFCPKFPQIISHSPGGLRDDKALADWQKALQSFGGNLGPSFMQLAPHFSYADKAELFHFLQSWPSEFELTLEFRHPSWFKEGVLLPPLVQYLQTRKVGLVITDVAGRRDVLHTSISAPFAILRFIGNDLHPSDFSRSERWAQRIQDWQEQGLQRFYFMVHEPSAENVPALGEKVVSDLNSVCAAGLTPLAKPLLSF